MVLCVTACRVFDEDFFFFFLMMTAYARPFCGRSASVFGTLSFACWVAVVLWSLPSPFACDGHTSHFVVVAGHRL